MKNIWGAAEFNGIIYIYGPDERMVTFDIDSGSFNETNYNTRFAKKTDETLYLWIDEGKLIIKNVVGIFVSI